MDVTPYIFYSRTWKISSWFEYVFVPWQISLVSFVTAYSVLSNIFAQQDDDEDDDDEGVDVAVGDDPDPPIITMAWMLNITQ